MSMSSLSAFLTTSGILPPAVSNEVKANTILSAFSGLDLHLDPNGKVSLKSSARDLIEKRREEKRQEVLHQEKLAQEIAQNVQAAKVKPATALTQAIASFAEETEELTYLNKGSNALAKKKGNKQLSRRARLRKEKGRERSENYNGKTREKSSRQIQRYERKEKYKRVY